MIWRMSFVKLSCAGHEVAFSGFMLASRTGGGDD